MRRPLAVVALLLAAPPPAAAQQTAGLRGFPRNLVAAQVRREEALRAVPHRDSLRARMRLLSGFPHEAGTERSRRVAELILQRFRSFGLDARIEEFEALMPRPVSRRLELVAPDTFTAALREPPLAEDPTSGQRDQLPTYNAYAADGDVTGELVYVNYGVPEDYRVLDSLGIGVRGKIVIARYGRSWRGIKPKLAAERGAIGCVIYSDPRDDGYFVDDVYPGGPMRPWQGVQRGSVMDMPTYPGDPLTPGWGGVAGGRKLARADVRTLVTIPVLPISYGDALPLLRRLDGPVAPEAWRGALPITYHVGPGPARVRLALSFDWATRPLYNVIATIRGATHPDEWVIYGNHHDAWVNGAEDPISGMVALEETARAFGALLRTGWRPGRTIVFAAWDGEEWGLLGSTEWAEHHAAELGAKAVVYYNSDTNDKGWIRAGGSHSLEAFFTEVARDVRDPVTGRSAVDVALERQREQRARRQSRDPDDEDGDSTFTISALGSGSDYTAFIDHLTLPTLDIRHGGGSRAGIYHSVYDSYAFYERFLDTSFAYGVAQAQAMATAIARMADAPLLPFEFTAPARTYRRYADEIEQLARKNDTTKALDLARVRAALHRLDTAAAAYEAAQARLASLPAARLDAGTRRALAEVNRALVLTERALSDTAGLPGRPWFRHLIYAPGYYTGYGVKTMPGIREAVEARRTPEAQAEAGRVARAIERYADVVERATKALEAALAARR